MLIKKIINKFIKKLSAKYIQSLVPAEHQKLIAYVERDRRKRLNKIKKTKLLALLGKDSKDSKEKAGDIFGQADADMKSSDGEDSSEDDNDQGGYN